LESLGLKALQARLENLLEQASKKEPSYADFLDELLNCEAEARRTRYLRAKLQLAYLPFVKNFEQFDFSFQPPIDERQIRELRSLRFIHEASNMIFLGPRGVGKTHLSMALTSSPRTTWRLTWGERIAKADWTAGCASTWHRRFW
jgi:DNA replication protein DnaC